MTHMVKNKTNQVELKKKHFYQNLQDKNEHCQANELNIWQ